MTPQHARLAAAPLPRLDHLPAAAFTRVYEPSDDTYLLADVLSAEAAELRRRRPALCVEIGAGSGALITHLGALLPPHSAALLATDVSAAAAEAARATGRANAQPVEVALADLLSALRPGQVDVLIFNPPYVPTSAAELREAEEARDLSAAWAGGPRGREVIDRLLPSLGAALSPTGLFYLLGVAENEPTEIAEQLKALHGFEGQLMAQRRAQNERLWVWRFSRGPGA
ncbi:hypothetical protein AB1Y20_006731 [Prymnesium parvum]|uniref:Methyltransferase small domain-containing protein n=1 Tax=Prymnesium parvum TaxID=97485 RepID=A0AB34IYN0_PRYPA